MIIFDISWPLSPESTTYKNKKDVVFEWQRTFQDDNVRESRIMLGSHAGTHVDAPAHFLPDGEFIEEVGLEQLVGWCKVLDLIKVNDKITAADLSNYGIDSGDIILLKTKNSMRSPVDDFTHDFVYLDASGAEYLAEIGVRAVGIDYLGIERAQPEHDTHKILFSYGIPIIEGLRLLHVEPDVYFLFCLPLRIEGLEAAPARAILVKEED